MSNIRVIFCMFVMALFSVICATASAQQDEQESNPEGVNPGERVYRHASPSRDYRARMDDANTERDFTASMASRIGVTAATRGLIEPLLLDSWNIGRTFGTDMNDYLLKTNREFRETSEKRGGPRMLAEYDTCISQKLNEQIPLINAKEQCAGLSHPEDQQGQNDNEEEGEKKEEKIEYLQPSSVVEKLSAKLLKKDREDFKKKFRKYYGDTEIIRYKTANGELKVDYKDKNVCEINLKDKDCGGLFNLFDPSAGEFIKKTSGLGFVGKLNEYQKDTFSGLQNVMTALCEDTNSRAGELESPLAVYTQENMNFDFWSNLDFASVRDISDPLAPGNSKKDDLAYTVMKRISILPAFKFDKLLGKQFLEIIKIDDAGRERISQGGGAVTHSFDCERSTKAGAKTFFEAIFRTIEVKDDASDLERFYSRFAKIIGGLRTLRKVEQEVAAIQDMVSFDEEPILVKMTYDIMNKELGSLKELGISANVSGRSIGEKLQIGAMLLNQQLDDLLAEISEYVARGRGQKMPAMITNQTRSAASTVPQ